MPNQKEIIPIKNKSTITIPWTALRKARFGEFPEVEVYLLNGEATPGSQTDPGYIKSPVQPYINDQPPLFTSMQFDFGGNANGFILIF